MDGMDSPPPLRGVVCLNCSECGGKGTIRNRKCPSCLGRRVQIYQHGRFIKLADPDPTREEIEAAKKEIQRQARVRRRAIDMLCHKCGSPNLETNTLCPKCAERNRAALRARNGGTIG